MINLPTSITGAPQTGFTSPTYSTTVDTPPDTNQKQVAVTGKGGTQAGVELHSVSSPFTISVSRPKSAAVLGKPNPVTGLIPSVGVNTYKVIVRKGVLPLAGQPYRTAFMRCEIEIPAGADTADAANIKAMLSAGIGTLWDISDEIGDTTLNGVL